MCDGTMCPCNLLSEEEGGRRRGGIGGALTRVVSSWRGPRRGPRRTETDMATRHADMDAALASIGEAGADSAMGTITNALVAAEWDIADEPVYRTDANGYEIMLEATAGSARIRITVAVLP